MLLLQILYLCPVLLGRIQYGQGAADGEVAISNEGNVTSEASDVLTKNFIEGESNITEDENEEIPNASNAAVPSGRQPTIKLSVSRYDGPEGVNYRVTCSGNSPFLSWIDPARKNITTITSGVVRVESNRLRNTSDLIFNPILRSYAGLYRCENFYLGQKTTADFTLIVQSPSPRPPVAPAIPTVQLSAQQYEGSVGGRFSLRCIGNSPNLTWTNSNNQDISSLRINDITISYDRSRNTSDLNFYPIRPNHAGIYRCVNNIQGRPAVSQFNFFVNTPQLNPTVKLSKNRDEGLIGSRISVLCFGNSPNLTWTDQYNRNLLSSPIQYVRVIPNQVQNTSELIFDRITNEHRGIYSCTNGIGKKTETEKFQLIPIARRRPDPLPQIPTVRLSAQQYEGPPGNRYSVSCSGNSPNLTWVNSNNWNLSSVRVNDISVTYDRRKNMLELIFNPIQPNHADVYTCINNIGGYQTNFPFRLTIIIPPLNPTVKLSKNRDEVLIGGHISVLCSGNSPNLVWIDQYNHDLSLSPVQFIRVVANRIRNTSELIFDSIAKEHGGIYSCTNTIENKAKTENFQLIPSVPKAVASINVPNRVEKYPTQSLSVICSGNSPVITWKNPVNGVIYQRTPGSTHDPHTIVGSQQVELKFDNIQMHYAGRYVCSVSLGESVDYKEFHLIVKEIPKLELVPPSEVINLDVKSSYKVECKNGDVSNLRWLGPDGRDISVHSGDKVQDKYTLYGKELKIKKANYQVGGIYTCVANVDGLTVQRTLAITVTKRQYLSDPSFVSFDSAILTKKVGDSFSITCSGDTDQLFWRGPPNNAVIHASSVNRIASGEAIRVDDDEFTKKLEGRLLNLNDEGVYVCEVVDGSQLKSRSLTLRIVEPTSFPSGLQGYYQVDDGGTVALECGARGHPKPSIEWYKQNGTSRLNFDGITYSLVDDKLVLTNAKYRYAGNYTCYAKQSAIDGNYGYRTVALNVNHKPVFPDGRYKTFYNYPGRAMNITCTDVSYPQSTYKWTKDGLTWAASKTISLSFNNVDEFGEYSCEASNIYGSEVQYTTVVRSEKPDIPDLKISLVSGMDVHYKITSKVKSVTHFILEYIPVDYVNTFYNASVTKDNVKRHVLNLKNPKTKYVFRAVSVNNVEKSDYSPNITITTGSASIVIHPSPVLQFTLLIFGVVCSSYRQIL